NPTHHEYQIDWTIAEYLVGDIYVAAPRVTGRRYLIVGTMVVGDSYGIGNESITPAVCSLDEPGCIVDVREGLANFGDRDFQDVRANVNVRPNSAEQLFFRYQLTRPFREITEDTECLGRQIDRR